MEWTKYIEIIERTAVALAAIAAIFPLYQYYYEAEDRERERIVREAMLSTSCSENLSSFKKILSGHLLITNTNTSISNYALSEAIKSYSKDRVLKNRLLKLKDRIPESQVKFLLTCSLLGYTTQMETFIIDSVSRYNELRSLYRVHNFC